MNSNEAPQPAPALPVQIREDYALVPLHPQPLEAPPAAYLREEGEQTTQLREFWHKVWRRKWLVLALVSLATAIAAMQAAQLPPIYQAATLIEVHRLSDLATRDDSPLREEFVDLNTAILLLGSNPVLEDVVASLRLDRNEAFLNSDRRRSLWEVLRGAPAKKLAPTPEETSLADEPVKSDPRHQRSREERNRLAPFVGMVRGGMQVENLQNSLLLKITFTHANPQITELVANQIAQVFIEHSFQKKTANYSNTSTWLNDATRKLEDQVKRAELELAKYTREHNIFSLDGKEDLSAVKLAHLHDQVMRAETERALKESLNEEARQGRVAQLPEAFANTGLTPLRQKLNDLTIQAAQYSVKFGANNPRVLELQQQMASLQKAIENSHREAEEKLQTAYQRAARDEEALQNIFNRARAEAVEQNQTSIQYNILKQNVATAKSLYTDFLQRTSQANALMAGQGRNLTIAELANTPGAPIGPLRRRTVFLSFVLSLAAAVALALLLDYFDNTIRTVEDVTRYARLPALGVIPTMDAPMSLALRQSATTATALTAAAATGAPLTATPLHTEEDYSAVAEAYRMLRTSVLLSVAGRPPQTILITSSQPGEGKTTTVANTGVYFSQLGASVLLIDADLRRPRLHKIFAVENQQGLSSYLSSGSAAVDELIQPTGVPHLSLLSSGLVPPNPADLIGSARMKELLATLAPRFDHILIDSPPVASVTDPVILSRLVDGVVCVVGGGKCRRELVQRARQELLSIGAKIFGVVLNNVVLQEHGYQYQYRYEYSSKRREW